MAWISVVIVMAPPLLLFGESRLWIVAAANALVNLWSLGVMRSYFRLARDSASTTLAYTVAYGYTRSLC